MSSMTEGRKKRHMTGRLIPLGQYMEESAAQVAAENAAITISDGWIQHSNTDLYHIELAEITDCMCLFGWVLYLIKKPWFTSLQARLFVESVCAFKGWPVPRM